MSSVRTYHQYDSIVFNQWNKLHGDLSLKNPKYPLSIYVHHIKTAHILYESLKFTHQPDIQLKVASCSNNDVASKLAIRHQNQIRADWEKVKYKMLKFCIELKAKQHEYKFRKVLESTKNHHLVFCDHVDADLGTIKNGLYYQGKNALGRLLMELRENVNNKSTNQFENTNLYFYGAFKRSNI